MFGDSSPSMPSTLRCASCERRWATNSAAPLSASATADAASGQEKAKVLNKSSVMPGRLRENRLCTKAKLRSRLIRLRLEREQLARPLDALERVAPDRHEAGALGLARGVRERRGDEPALLDGAAERRDAARLVHGRPDDGEVEPLPAADIAVEDLPDVETEIGIGDGELARRAVLVQSGKTCAHQGLGVKRRPAGLAGLAGREDRERAVADELQDVTAGLVHGGDDRLRIVVEEGDDLAGRRGLGDA